MAFQRGQSGNPGGRKKSIGLSDAMRKAAEKHFDLSGRQALTEAKRVFLRELSTVPGAVEIAREQVDLMLLGVPDNSPEMLDVHRRMQRLWDAHVASKAQ